MHCRDVITMSTSAGYHAVKTLSEFWSQIDRTQLSPRDDLLTTRSDVVVGHCLANIGTEYIVHLHGQTLAMKTSRTFELVLSGISQGRNVRGVWTDTTTGATSTMTETVKDGPNVLVAPAGYADSYVLRIVVN
eukprot:COSAG02_NODE_5708_length_4104_cov_6.627216_2_plen_133_part_00